MKEILLTREGGDICNASVNNGIVCISMHLRSCLSCHGHVSLLAMRFFCLYFTCFGYPGLRHFRDGRFIKIK